MSLNTSHLICFAAGALLCAAALHHSNDFLGTVEGAVENSFNNSFSDASLITAMQAAPDATRRSALSAEPALRGVETLRPGHATVECCLKVAEEIDAVMAKRLRDQQAQNPSVFAQQLQMNGQRLMELCALRQVDPSLYNVKLQEMKVDAQVLRVGRELCKAVVREDKVACKSLEGELRGALETQLLYEIKARGDFIIQINHQVERLRSELDSMASQWQQTVDQRLHEMRTCRDPDNPRWEPVELLDHPPAEAEIPAE